MKASAPSAYDKLSAAKAAVPTGTASQSYKPLSWTPPTFGGNKFQAGLMPQQLTPGAVQMDTSTPGRQGQVAAAPSNADIAALYAKAKPVNIPISMAVGNRGSSQATFNRLSPQAQAVAYAAALRRDAAMAKVQEQIKAQASAAQAARNATAQNWAYNTQQWGGGNQQGMPIAAMANQQRMSR